VLLRIKQNNGNVGACLASMLRVKTKGILNNQTRCWPVRQAYWPIRQAIDWSVKLLADQTSSRHNYEKSCWPTRTRSSTAGGSVGEHGGARKGGQNEDGRVRCQD